MVRVAALMVVAFVAVTACVAQPGAPSAGSLPPVPAAASVALTASLASQPSDGISEARAIELARDHTSLTNFVSASAGPFRDLNIQPGVGPGFPVKPNQIVWAVTFSGDVTICSPMGNCFSPRPGIIAVYLDVLTGDFLGSATNAPAP
jgi:hypothetical protein